MVTSVWGPALWHVLHTMSFNYPTNPSKTDKKYYKEFLTNLIYVLPCKYCRINFINNLKQMPITLKVMKNRDSFSRYVYNLHELINKMLNKKSTLTYCQVRERYEHFRSRCTNNETPIDTETGCTEPLYGNKSKCIINIVPQQTKGESIIIDKTCIKHY